MKERLLLLADLFLQVSCQTLKIGISKCELVIEKVTLLDHTISIDKIAVNTDDTKEILAAQVPANVTALKSVLEFTEYYRNYIQGFTGI